VQGERHGDSQTVEGEDMSDEDIRREVLPIPDRWQVGLTTYEATDPDNGFLADPAGAAAGGRAERAGGATG
jgi:hypothetical protein